MKRIGWIIAALIALVGCSIASADESATFLSPVAYLPVVQGGPTAVPTLVPPPTPIPPTPTWVPTVDPWAGWIEFLTGYQETRMKGRGTGSVRRTSLTDYWGDTHYPLGVYIVFFMDVVNFDVGSAYVSGYGTFWMRDGTGPHYDMADLDPQMAAEYEYDRMGTYEDLQPRFLYNMVFVFDVPASGSYSLWYVPWGSGSAVLVQEDSATIVDESALQQFQGNW